MALSGDYQTREVEKFVEDSAGNTRVRVESSSGDASSGTEAHVSHFGVLKAGPTIPVLKGNFPGSSLDRVQWDEIIISGGSTTVADGVAKLQTGTKAGQVTVYQSGVYAGVGVADNVRIWGLMDRAENNGLYFKWNGTTFQVVAKKGGTETAVNQTSFSGESDWSPIAANNTFRIEYSAGRALFFRASGGKKVLLHAMVDGDLPLVDDLDLGLYYENTNSGNTTDVELRVRGASSSVWGSLNRYNKGGALLTSEFGTEVSLGVVSNYSINTKFGRNGDIDTNSDPEDVWAGGGNYTGFNATGNENIEVLSSDADDQGSLVSSGTATGGSSTTIVDSGADFVSDGVAVGDVIVNDTVGAHGVITAVTATTITVFRMQDKGINPILNNNGDSYRVVNANDTGAALVRLDLLLDEDFAEQDPVYVILNGTSGVTVTGNYMRCSRASVILAGSSDGNEGTITVRQATSTSNVFAVMPSQNNQTTIGATTVPAGKVMLLKRIRAAITRANGSPGSATVMVKARRKGEVFRAIRDFELQTGAAVEFTQIGADILPGGTDIKFRVEQVSDNNTIIDCAFEYFLVDVETV